MDPLQIIISAVDDTEGAFASVGEQMEELSGVTDTATTQMEADLNEFGLTMNSVTGEIDEALMTQQQSFDMAAAVVTQDDQEIIDQMLATGSTAGEAAADIEEANAAIAASSEVAAGEVETANASSMGSYAAMGGVGLLAFNSITGALGTSIKNAETWAQSSAVIQNNLTNMGSSIPLSALQAYALQIQQNTLFTQNDAIQAEAQLSGYKALTPQYGTLIPLAADLATKMQAAGLSGGTLQNAMKLLSDAMANPAAGMTRLINQAGTALPASLVTMLTNMAKANDTASAGKQIYDDLNNAIGGSATAAANAAGGPLIQLDNQLTALGQDMVQGGLLTDLDKIAKAMIPIIEAVAQWTEAHPKLTEALIAGIVVFTALITILGLVGVAVALMGVGMAGLAVGIAAAVAIIVGVVIDNWSSIEDKTKELWSFMELLFKSGLAGIQIIWLDGWNLISTIVMDIWNTIGNTVKTGVNDVINAINAFINALDSLHINIPAITIPGTKLGTPAIDLGFNIPDIPMLAAGGIVYNPTMAMIGEAGPEAVVPLSSYGGASGGQPINIYIQGGNYLDKQGADTIAQALATKIQRQLKLTSFR